MEKKISIHDVDFEAYLENALKSFGYIFPTTDEQMSIFEENMEDISLSEEFESPDFVFENKKRIFKRTTITVDNSEGERNWALAAREGKDIPEEILVKMKRDKAEAKKKQNGHN